MSNAQPVEATHDAESDLASDIWVEEVDEVMFQPTEIVPNAERCYKGASELQKQIVARLRRPAIGTQSR